MNFSDLWQAIKSAYSTKEWHSHLTHKPVVLIDGSTAYGYVMRRKINKQWQYRQCTEVEAEHMAWMRATK